MLLTANLAGQRQLLVPQVLELVVLCAAVQDVPLTVEHLLPTRISLASLQFLMAILAAEWR